MCFVFKQISIFLPNLSNALCGGPWREQRRGLANVYLCHIITKMCKKSHRMLKTLLMSLGTLTFVHTSRIRSHVLGKKY